MALDGIIFDLDGTLVDTNGAHVEAWRKSLESHGYKVAADRIFLEIGKGGDQLVPAILGKEADARDGDALRHGWMTAYESIAASTRLNVFPGAKDLIAELKRRGLKLVLATSSKEKTLEATERSAGFPVRELMDEVVMADDVEASKPAPDVVQAAVAKLKLSPAQCAMVGDTNYDAEAAKGAGVVCLGLTGGGHEPATLLRAGCRAVWRDPADLLAHLDDALRVASPGPARLTTNVLHDLMRAALAAAHQGMQAGEVPIGCVLATGDGRVVASGFNELNGTKNKTAHAEIVTFAKAAGKTAPDARDLILLSTLEPCVMCLGAAMEAAVDTVVYGLRAPADSGTGRVAPPQSPESQMPRIVPDVLAVESRAMLEEWLRLPDRNAEQVKFVKQLLSLA